MSPTAHGPTQMPRPLTPDQSSAEETKSKAHQGEGNSSAKSQTKLKPQESLEPSTTDSRDPSTDIVQTLPSSEDLQIVDASANESLATPTDYVDELNVDASSPPLMEDNGGSNGGGNEDSGGSSGGGNEDNGGSNGGGNEDSGGSSGGGNEDNGGSSGGVSASTREKSVFVRISNRINSLESNTSILNSYLEQISARYGWHYGCTFVVGVRCDHSFAECRVCIYKRYIKYY